MTGKWQHHCLYACNLIYIGRKTEGGTVKMRDKHTVFAVARVTFQSD